MRIRSFSQIVGNDTAKLALVTAVVDPSINVIIKGTKGTGKSTLIRTLTSILPSIQVIDPECPFNCSRMYPNHICEACLEQIESNSTVKQTSYKFQPKVVTLPLSISEVNLHGTVELDEYFDTENTSIFARANNQILFVDEINLLDTETTNLLLNPPVIRTHRGKLRPRFTLVATYNVEEGRLRNHLGDRFDIGLDITSSTSSDIRVAIIKANLDLTGSNKVHKAQALDSQIKQQIKAARQVLHRTHVETSDYNMVTSLTNKMNLEGHRPDIAVIKVARALATYQAQPNVTEADLYIASKLCLHHRIADDQLQFDKKLSKLFDEVAKEEIKQKDAEPQGAEPQDQAEDESESAFQKIKKKIRPLLRRSPKLIVLVVLTVGVILAALLGIKTVTDTNEDLFLLDFIVSLIIVAPIGILGALLAHLFIKPRPRQHINKDEEYVDSVKKGLLRVILTTNVILPIILCIVIYAILTLTNRNFELQILHLDISIEPELFLFIIPFVVYLGFNTIKKQRMVAEHKIKEDIKKREEAPLQVVNFPKTFANPVVMLFFVLVIPVFSFFGFWYAFQDNPLLALALGILFFFLFMFGVLLLTKQSAPGWSKRGLYDLKPSTKDGPPEYFKDPYKRQMQGNITPLESALPDQVTELEKSTEQFENVPEQDTNSLFVSKEAPVGNFLTNAYVSQLSNTFKVGAPIRFSLRQSFSAIKDKLVGEEPVNLLKTQDGALIKRKMTSVMVTDKGRVVGSKIPKNQNFKDVHLLATIIEGIRANHITKHKLDIQKEDIRETRRIARAKASIIFILDLSASMQDAINAVKASIDSLHQNAYQRRDRVSVIACKNDGAIIAQHPTTTLSRVERAINDLGISGLTPLASGVLKAIDVIKQEKRRDPGIIPVIVLVTDGGACVPLQFDLIEGKERKFNSDDLFSGRLIGQSIKDFLYSGKMLKKEKPNVIIIKPWMKAEYSSKHGFKTLQRFRKITGGQLCVPTKHGLEVLIKD